MNKRILVDVTQEDIEMGERRASMRCPVALAVRRVPELSACVVGPKDVISDSPAHPNGLDIPLPGAAIKFVLRFDSGRPVRPFSFELELPEGD